VISNTSAAAQITPDPAALIGARTVSVSTGIKVAAETNGFQVVSLTLTLISPNTGQQGQQNFSLAVTGQSPLRFWQRSPSTADASQSSSVWRPASVPPPDCSRNTLLNGNPVEIVNYIVVNYTLSK
jgi:hypothetical protein